MTDSEMSTFQPPVRLCCGQRHAGVQCPDGLVWCCMCFERFPVDQLYLDPADGKRVDVCQTCHDKDVSAGLRHAKARAKLHEQGLILE